MSSDEEINDYDDEEDEYVEDDDSIVSPSRKK